jgi:hypothetical protein
LAEFGLDVQVIVADLEGGQHIHTARDLLPVAFTQEHLRSYSSDGQ